MVDDTAYVQSVRQIVGMVTEQWEQRENTAGYNKSWEIYFEAAEEIANLAFRFSADPNQVPTLVRDYFFTLTNDVRNRMATKSVNCGSARTSVAARARRQAMQTKDVVKIEACHAAASLLEKAGDIWVIAPSTTLSAVYIGGQATWNEVVGNAQAAARAAFDNRAQPSEISDLFGGFFNRFMVVVRTRRKVEGLSWGATKKSVAGVMLRGYISTDPVRAAAYTAAALMLEAVPSGDIAESPIPPPYSVPRQVVAPAAAAAATPAAELARIIGPNGPSACVNTLSTPPAAATLISGTRNTVASTTKGYSLNTLTETTLPDHAGTSPTASGENKSNNDNNNNNNNINTTTKPVSLAMMPPPTGINRTRWAKQRYSRSGSGNDPTKGRPTTPSGLPRSMDTVGVGSSSSGIYDAPGGASIVPGVAPTTAAGAAGVASGVAANPAPFSADQGAGAIGCCSSSGQHTSEDALETEAPADGIDWYGVMNILVPTAPNAATGEALDVDSSIYNSIPETLGSGNSVLGIGIDSDVPVASETAAAAATPSPVVAAARMGAAGVAMAASPDSALKPNVLVATAAEARAPTAAGAASSPVAEGRNTGTGKKRRATGDEGGTENPRCDGGARKKARSRSVENRA